MNDFGGILSALFSPQNQPALLGATAGLLGGGNAREQLSRGLLGLLQGQQLGARLQTNQLQQRIYSERLADSERQNAARQRAAGTLGPLADVAEAYPTIAARMFSAQNPEAAVDPSAVREYQYFQKLSPADQQRYIAVKRAQQNVNVGDAVIQPDPINPGKTMGQFAVGAPPKTAIQDDRIVTAPPVVPTQRGGQGVGQGGVADLPLARKDRDLQESKVNVADNMLSQIDSILNDKNLPWGTGVSSVLNKLPGTALYDFQQRVEQLRGQAFLQAFETLKGGGQITQVEGDKATQAIGRLSTAQTTGGFKQALNELRSIVETARARAAGKAGMDVQPAKQSTRIRYDAQGNEIQ